ncbi:hypothetical protein J3455_01435 [Pseudoalteromonas sp. NFXS39]|uniref:hypothetical protein n=1 Tax=Pseudoalteromonas sp. NFXS39 TaxID=2818437 RepID=UPI0032DF9157
MSNIETITQTLMSQFNVNYDKAKSVSETLLSNYLLKGNDKAQFYPFFERHFSKAHTSAGNNIDTYLEYMVSMV